ncbi:MAG: LON peptidase substrate-binding domain-containing protein [Anaerolineae bacterium]|nr:LON peptidase substrate-binding domain-containing protein [Anaerolineae bacterium]
MTVVDNWGNLPLFPLNTVLFPGMLLPLRIFEERYKRMIDLCLEEKQPFGVVLIREGEEVGGSAVPYEVGTTATIQGVSRQDDGKMSIVTVGKDRFRLRKVHRDLPYLVGEAEPWPLREAVSQQAWEQVEPMRVLLHQYLQLLSQAQGHKIEIEEIPDDPATLALLVAVALQVPLAQKQSLLSQPTVPQMFLAERAILHREERLLQYMIDTQEEQWEGGFSGYLAKN